MKLYPKKAITRDIATQINYKLGTVLTELENLIEKGFSQWERDTFNTLAAHIPYEEIKKEVAEIRQLLLDNIEE